MNRDILCIAKYIYAYLQGTISEEELLELEEWKNNSEVNKQLFERLLKTSFYNDKVDAYRRFDRYYNFAGLQKYLQRKRWILRFRYSAVAAAILIPLFLVLFLLPQQGEKETFSLTSATLQPGHSQATLVLSDGSQRDLAGENFTISLEGTQAINNANQLAYADTGSIIQSEEKKYNTIIVPRGGEYQLMLSDGSKLWLNSESSVRFPVKFDREIRDITVSGEVYLKVAKDRSRPFIVNTGDFAIRVLGTSFNIRAYKNENAIYTTLVEGKIRIDAPDGRQFNINPSEQLYYNKQLSQYTTKQVDTDLYISWKDGIYVFEKQSLEDVLETISRWYDLTVLYVDSDVKDISFSGRIKRYEDASTILQLIESLGGVKFSVQGRTLFVQKE